jgi:hypothetical protein
MERKGNKRKGHKGLGPSRLQIHRFPKIPKSEIQIPKSRFQTPEIRMERKGNKSPNSKFHVACMHVSEAGPRRQPHALGRVGVGGTEPEGQEGILGPPASAGVPGILDRPSRRVVWRPLSGDSEGTLPFPSRRVSTAAPGGHGWG